MTLTTEKLGTRCHDGYVLERGERRIKLVLLTMLAVRRLDVGVRFQRKGDSTMSVGKVFLGGLLLTGVLGFCTASSAAPGGGGSDGCCGGVPPAVETTSDGLGRQWG